MKKVNTYFFALAHWQCCHISPNITSFVKHNRVLFLGGSYERENKRTYIFLFVTMYAALWQCLYIFSKHQTLPYNINKNKIKKNALQFLLFRGNLYHKAFIFCFISNYDAFLCFVVVFIFCIILREKKKTAFVNLGASLVYVFVSYNSLMRHFIDFGCNKTELYQLFFLIILAECIAHTLLSLCLSTRSKDVITEKIKTKIYSRYVVRTSMTVIIVTIISVPKSYCLRLMVIITKWITII